MRHLSGWNKQGQFMRHIISLAVFVFFLGQSLVAHSQISASERNNLRYACEASGKISGAEVDGNWCQCMNDYYLDKMTAADWTKYSRDYYALEALQDVQSEANSYTRHLQVGSGHCISCKEKNYRGCLKSDERVAQYASIIENLTTGQFQLLEKDTTYKLFYTDFIRSYSKQCSAYIRDGVIKVHVYDDPVLGTGGSIMGVEQKFLQSYNRYAKYVNLNFVMELGRKTQEAITAQNPLLLMDLGFDIVSRDAILNAQISGKCTTPKIRALHTNLERFDKGLPPLTTLASTRAPASAAEKKRAEIYAYTKASYDKAVAAYAPIRAKYDVMSCPSRQDEATQMATPLSPGGENMKDLEGAWSGDFYGEPAELAIWHVQHTPETTPIALGILYFADRQCTMSFNIHVYGTPALAMVRANPNYRQPIDCMATAEIDKDKGGFGFRGDFALKDGAPTFMLTEIKHRLKANATCTGNDPTFSRSRASSDFKKAILDINAAPDPNMVKPTPAQISRMTR